MNNSTDNCNAVRKGCKDVWNAYMCQGVSYDVFDIPFCPTTAAKPPSQIVTWDAAKALYNKKQRKEPDFFEDAFVSFYVDDCKFDGPKGIWYNPDAALRVLCHFAGVITPDFSTYQDFPIPLKLYNTFRMRAMGCYLGRMGLSVINNVRWGSPDTYDFSFAGLPHNSILAIGTVGGSPRTLENRARFEAGLAELVRRLTPHTIVVYGSANYPCFDRLKELGIAIFQYPSKTAQAYARRLQHV